MNTKELKELSIELMDAVRQKNLSSFELKTDEFKIHIETQSAAPAAAPVVASAVPTAVDAPAAAQSEEFFQGTPVEAPLVGIFYSAPAPEDPPFIEVGQSVKKGDTLFIIEAMKTMNEITAPCDGTISRVMVQNGDMVEYKQVLVVIE